MCTCILHHQSASALPLTYSLHELSHPHLRPRGLLADNNNMKSSTASKSSKTRADRCIKMKGLGLERHVMAVHAALLTGSVNPRLPRAQWGVDPAATGKRSHVCGFSFIEYFHLCVLNSHTWLAASSLYVASLSLNTFTCVCQTHTHGWQHHHSETQLVLLSVIEIVTRHHFSQSKSTVLKTDQSTTRLKWACMSTCVITYVH